MSRIRNEKAAPARAALQNRQNHPNTILAESQLNHVKPTLISPLAVLDLLGVRYRQAGVRLSVFCPFHKDGQERNPSLSMHPTEGYYRCFACGAKGHDVIAFYRAITGNGFAEALKVLGGTA